MLRTGSIYLIYWGWTPNRPPGTTIIPTADFEAGVQTILQRGYLGKLDQYYPAQEEGLSGLILDGSRVIPYYPPSPFSDTDVENLLTSLFTQQVNDPQPGITVPYEPNGLYFVLTAGAAQSDQWRTKGYIGEHSTFTPTIPNQGVHFAPPDLVKFSGNISDGGRIS